MSMKVQEQQIETATNELLDAYRDFRLSFENGDNRAFLMQQTKEILKLEHALADAILGVHPKTQLCAGTYRDTRTFRDSPTGDLDEDFIEPDNA